MPNRDYESPGRIVRTALAVVTVGFGLFGLFSGEARLLVAAGAFGILWTLFDFLWDYLVAPFGDWAGRTLLEGGGGPPANARPTVDDTIRLLENHLTHGASRGVEIQAAVRLEELYRTVRKDPVRARDVVRRISAKYPDAEELTRYREEESGG